MSPTERDQARNELAPAGVLRAAIALSPAPSPFFAVRGRDGTPEGVTVDLARQLATELDLKLDLVVYPNSGEITERASAGEWDVTFMPADAERAKKVAFGPPYALVESTFLIAPDSGIRSYEGVDKSGVRVVAIANTATARSAARFLKEATLDHAATVAEAAREIRDRRADALALSRDALARIAADLPGARVLDGRFHAAGVAVAVPPGRTASLRLVSDFIERAKRSGEVARALERAGLRFATVAPPVPDCGEIATPDEKRARPSRNP